MALGCYGCECQGYNDYEKNVKLHGCYTLSKLGEVSSPAHHCPAPALDIPKISCAEGPGFYQGFTCYGG